MKLKRTTKHERKSRRTLCLRSRGEVKSTRFMKLVFKRPRAVWPVNASNCDLLVHIVSASLSSSASRRLHCRSHISALILYVHSSLHWNQLHLRRRYLRGVCLVVSSPAQPLSLESRHLSRCSSLSFELSRPWQHVYCRLLLSYSYLYHGGPSFIL